MSAATDSGRGTVPPACPEGRTVDAQGRVYWEDAQGRLVPEEQVREIDRARDDLVREKVAKAKARQADLRAFKGELFDDVSAFVELSAERYDVKLGGKKGNVTLQSYDGRYQIQRQVSEHLTFDEGLMAAKTLIDECLREWTAGSPGEIRALVDYAFQVDKQGRINTGRILGLRRLDIEDERWQRAMKAIGDSLQVAGSRAYVRVYERDERGVYQPISLDMATL